MKAPRAAARVGDPICPIGTVVGRAAGVGIVAASARERNSDPIGGRLLLLLRSISLVDVEADFRFPVAPRGPGTATSKRDCSRGVRRRQAREPGRYRSPGEAAL
jgi:hypothetical protein